MIKPSHILLELTDSTHKAKVTELLTHINISTLETTQNAEKITQLVDDVITVKSFIDGRGLSCPQPLLQTKIALKKIEKNQWVYMIATDSNSQQDLMAFAKQGNRQLHQYRSDNEKPNLPTIYHFFIQS